MKKIKLNLVLGLLVALFLCCVVAKVDVSAAQYTKASIEAKIKKLNSEIDELRAKTRKMNNIVVIFGEPVNYSPMIIKNAYTNTYYYFNDSSKLTNNIIFCNGYAKLTGKTKDVYIKGIPTTCYVCDSISEPAEYTKINEKNKEITKLNGILEDRYVIDWEGYQYEKKVGDSFQLEGRWKNDGNSNSITYKCSNKNIATIDKNGLITCLKAGKVTISATTKISGYKSKITLKVIDPVKYAKMKLNMKIYVDPNSLKSIKITSKNITLVTNDLSYGITVDGLPVKDGKISYELNDCKYEIIEKNPLDGEEKKVGKTAKTLKQKVANDMKEQCNPYCMEITVKSGKVTNIKYYFNASLDL